MFALSKILGGLTEPLNLLLLALCLGFALLFGRAHARWGRRIIGIVLAFLVVPAIVPLDRWAIAALEDRFAPPDPLPQRVDGIIVLGGGVNPVISARRGRIAMNGAVARVIALVPLARTYPDARLVFTGGSGSLADQDFKEAPYTAELLREIGFDASRVIFESQSRNTVENAILSKQLVAPKAGETWLLVTSAFHMARAVGVFRRAGWPVVAYPVDYHTPGPPGLADWGFSAGHGMAGLALLTHELAGLLAYRLMGRTDALIPAP
jgi:uncharacterized SAM-binding protein YcdF (DUF218 family)